MSRYVEVRPCKFVWHLDQRHVEEVLPDEVPQFWGVYQQEEDGHIMHVKDFTKLALAVALAAELRGTVGAV